MTFPAENGAAYSERYGTTEALPPTDHQVLAPLHPGSTLADNFRWPPGYADRAPAPSDSSTAGFVFPSYLPEKLSPSYSTVRYHDTHYGTEPWLFDGGSRCQDQRLHYNSRLYEEQRMYELRMQEYARNGIESARQQLPPAPSYGDVRMHHREPRGSPVDLKASSHAMRQTLLDMRFVDDMKMGSVHPLSQVDDYRHTATIPDSLINFRGKLSADNFSATDPLPALSKVAPHHRLVELMEHLPHHPSHLSAEPYLHRMPPLTPPLAVAMSPSRQRLIANQDIDRKSVLLSQLKNDVQDLKHDSQSSELKNNQRLPAEVSPAPLLSLQKTEETPSSSDIKKEQEKAASTKEDSPTKDPASSDTNSSRGKPSPDSEEKSPDDAEGSPKQNKDSDTGLPSYTAMIAKAILDRDGSKSTLADIYEYMEKSFPSLERRGTGWRNCVRHTLSLNDCFVKLHRPENGRSCNWAIHPSYFESFARGDYRKRRALRKRPRALQWMDPMMMNAFPYMREHELAHDNAQQAPFYHYPSNMSSSSMWPSPQGNYHQQPAMSQPSRVPLQHYPPSTQHHPAHHHHPHHMNGMGSSMSTMHCTNPSCYCQAKARVYTP